MRIVPSTIIVRSIPLALLLLFTAAYASLVIGGRPRVLTTGESSFETQNTTGASLDRLTLGRKPDGIAASLGEVTHLQSANFGQPPKLNRASLQAGVLNHSLFFEPNLGQFNSATKFIARGSGASLALTTDSAVLLLNGPYLSDVTKVSSKNVPPRSPNVSAIQMDFLGGRKVKPVGESPSHAVVNYFVGKSPSVKLSGIHPFKSVRYKGLYSGVDLVFHANSVKSLEYDYIVAPNTDPAVVSFGITGASNIIVNKGGDLILKVADGVVTCKQPVAYQSIGGKQRRVDARYVLKTQKGRSNVSFALGVFDRSKALVIDPEVIYSTYLGGSGSELVTPIASDGTGAVVLAGATVSVDFPMKNAYQPLFLTAPHWDAFITKFDSSGDLIYSTYFGGSGDDIASQVAVDILGNVTVAGQTNSNDLWTINAAQSRRASSYDWDVFVARFDASGLPKFSTYLGGQNGESVTGLAVDSGGNSVVAGITSSPDFPVTQAFQDSLHSHRNGFVTRFSSNGVVLFSTFLGGSALDTVEALGVTKSGTTVVTGLANSTDFPVVNSSSTVHNGNGDMFVTSFDPTGGVNFSTLIGGNDADIPYGIAMDLYGNALICGGTHSSDFPTKNAYQSSAHGGYEAFLTSISSTGNINFCTLIGGKADDIALSVAVDAGGNPTICGSTKSTDLPTLNAMQTNGGKGWGNDAFVARFNSTGKPLYITYLGGSGDDIASCLASDSDGNVLVCGSTASGDFLTVAPLQTFSDGAYHGFATYFTPKGTVSFSTYVPGAYGFPAPTVTVDPTGCFSLGGSTIAPDLNVKNAVQTKYMGGVDGDGYVTRLAFGAYLKSLTFSPSAVTKPGDLTTATVTASGIFKTVNLTFDSTQFTSTPPAILLKSSTAGTWVKAIDTAFLLKATANPVTVTAVGTRSDGTSVRLCAALGISNTTFLSGNQELSLMATSPYSKKKQVVDAVACDNSSVTPVDQQTSISFQYSPKLSFFTNVTGYVSSRAGDSSGTLTEGTVTSSGSLNSVIYTPPLEFNRDQTPASINHVDTSPTRDVYLTLRGYINGKLTVVGDRKITLVRPVVVLVHGINNSSHDWRSGGHSELPWCQQSQRFPIVEVEHGDVLKGNGPVELAAYRLEQTINQSLRSLWSGTFDQHIDPVVNFSDNYYGYDFHNYKNLRIASRRVDIVAWSYGGMIARWYIASDGSRTSMEPGVNEFGWYKPYPHVGYKTPHDKWFDAFDPKTIPGATYGKDVRKLITIGTMWRGVPMANYVNEANLSDGSGSLNEAPIGPLFNFKNLGEWLDNWLGNKYIVTKAPSMQVMGIGSQWLSRLLKIPNKSIYPSPFRDELLYASVGGDNSHYNVPSGLYSNLVAVQQPSLFPYFLLECRDNQAQDFTDGIVPLWTSCIPGSYRVVHCNHSTYPYDPDTRASVFCWLNDSSMKSGGYLTTTWNDNKSVSTDPTVWVASADQAKVWQFEGMNSAPSPQAKIYANGRIASSPQLIYQRNSVGDLQVGYAGSTLTLTWSTPDFPCTTESVIVSDGTLPYLLFQSRSIAATTKHSWIISNVQFKKHGMYTITVQSNVAGMSLSQIKVITNSIQHLF